MDRKTHKKMYPERTLLNSRAFNMVEASKNMLMQGSSSVELTAKKWGIQILNSSDVLKLNTASVSVPHTVYRLKSPFI